MKAKQDFLYWSSAKCRKILKIVDSVKSALQKWITSHPHVIQSPIANDYSKVKLAYGNGGANTELSHKLILQVSVCELHIYMLKKYSTRFSMAYDEKVLVRIIICSLRLLLPPQLLKI